MLSQIYGRILTRLVYCGLRWQRLLYGGHTASVGMHCQAASREAGVAFHTPADSQRFA